MSKELPTMSAHADALARLHTAEAMGTVVEVMRDKFAKPSEKLKAAEMILDRGHGKAAQAVIAVPARQALASRMAQLDDSALLAIAAAARQIRMNDGTLPALEAPFGMVPDDVTEAEWKQANPPKEPDYDLPAAQAEEFPSSPKLPGNPWD
jgi:hypothetical protein